MIACWLLGFVSHLLVEFYSELASFYGFLLCVSVLLAEQVEGYAHRCTCIYVKK